ncbi:hypothetical protein BDB01DRAFT_847892 [Pilobolus umbonatus]|nr:hypothetical protein BDB01DRAFT_847892 [Pilobolus umbonatus]
MLDQEHIYPPAYVRKQNVRTQSVYIDLFLKEARQLLRNADTLSNVDILEKESAGDHTEEESVLWKFDIHDNRITLNTNICTISGFEKVIELLRKKAQQPSSRHRPSKRTHYSLFHPILKPIFELSNTLYKPTVNIFNHHNSIQLMKHCVHSFIRCGYSFFLDVPSLIASTEKILSQPGAAQEHTIETLLILSICTLMIRHTITHHGGDLELADILTHTYHHQAHQILQNLFDVHDMTVVQSMFLLSVYPQGHIHLLSPYRSNTFLLNMAIRMALSMDIHHLDLHYNNTTEQVERVRRFAWMLLCADYFAAWNEDDQNCGLIEVSEWHVDFPRPLPTEISTQTIDYFSHYCRVIMHRKMDLFGCTLKSPNTWGLDEHYYSIHFDIPDKFKLNLLNPHQVWNKSSDLESLLLYELYSHTQIFAQLPLLPPHYFTVFASEEEEFRQANFSDLYQQITRSSSSIPSTHLPYTSLEYDMEQEFHYLVGCMTIINYYTLILEALASIDHNGCYHNPIYGVVLTSLLYIIIARSCPDPEIRSVCHINLHRTYCLLIQTKLARIDPAILFLERTFTKHNIPSKKEISTPTLSRRSHDIMRSLQSKLPYLYKSYDDGNDEKVMDI